MKKYLYLLILLLFIICKERIIINSIEALNMWSTKLFPILFPTFILSDLLLSSDIVPNLVNRFGPLYERIFKVNKYGLYIFLISMIAGTPTNAKVLAILKDNNILNDDEINKILCHSILFNPFLIISYGGYKLLLIIWLSNIITGLILRNIKVKTTKRTYHKLDFKFNLNESISKNLTILLNILGTVTIFSSIIAIIPKTDIYFKFFLISSLEVTNALNFVTNFLNANISLYSISFALGGLSIITQIKSILKDTLINYKLLIFSRLIVACICKFLCLITITT